MEPFPFTEAEWAAVKEAAFPIVSAGDDAVLRASHLIGLLDVLAGLRARHGEHPVLLETQADFVEDEAERVALYRHACAVAQANGLPTLSIRLSLARVLLDRGEPDPALAELQACEGEIADGDESERTEWAGLAAEASDGSCSLRQGAGPGG